MAETLVENKICQACGADIREGALFCYNCGETVALKSDARNVENGVSANQMLPKEKFTENGSKAVSPKLAAPPDVQPNIPVDEIEKPLAKSEPNKEQNLKSAASLRKKPKSIQKKTVEINWQEYEKAPNLWFVLAAIVLFAFVAVVVWLELYS